MRHALHALTEELRRLKTAGVKTVAVSEESVAALRRVVTAHRPSVAAPARDEKHPASAPPEEPMRRVPTPAKPVALAAAAVPEFPPAPVVKLPEGDKVGRWTALLDLVTNDAVCRANIRPGKKIVLGVGSVEAPIMFVGEAPGAEEEIQGEPFVGPAGQLLTKMIQAMGLRRGDVYIGNIMNWRPQIPTVDGREQSGNRPPTEGEMRYCLPYLRAQIEVVNPRLMVALGKTAVEGLLGFGKFKTLGEARGHWHEYAGKPLMVTYHPSYLLRPPIDNRKKRLVWEDLLKVMERLALPISEKQRGFFFGKMKRTLRLIALAGALAICDAAVFAAAEAVPFDFAALRARAKMLAAAPHVARSGEVPEWLRKLTYDELRLIEFDGNESLWKREGLPFQVQFLHPGFLYDKTVRVSELRGARAEPVAFRREYFNYRALSVGDIPATMGFAGFRLMFPLDGPGNAPKEAGSFLGASYFRFLCAGAGYGLSARGLALDTATAGPEEFPAFTEFWLERPEPRATSLGVLALMESESVTGAYRFTISPGAGTVVQVKAAIYRRSNSAVFGVAPLTSMFWRGENSNSLLEDYRPEVHDSDGLLMHNGRGEWIWRPLDNPRHVRVATFSDENPRAFGLLQRDRNFENYQDLEAAYHARPSAWVKPVGSWGRGAVRLVELPTKDEFNDNVVAFWSPEKLPPLGEPVEVEYRLHWFLDQIRPPAGFVRATRHGKSAYYEPGLGRFVVDFDGAQLQSLGPDAKIEHVLSVGEGATLNHSALQKNPVNGTWRVAFTLRPDGTGRPVELRCFLRRPAQVLTETWSYLWQP